MKTIVKQMLLLLLFGVYQLAFSQSDYQVTVTDKDNIEVKATMFTRDNQIHLPIMATEGLSDGPAELIRNLRVTDANGKPISISGTKNNGNYFSWQLDTSNAKISIHYEIEMLHDQYNWPFGVEEISYRTSEGFMIIGRYLFIVSEWDDKNCSVSFNLPGSWQISSPWNTSTPGRYEGLSGLELRDNVLFIGNHQEEKVVIGDTELKLVLGPSLQEDKSKILEYLEPNMKAIGSLFGSAPRGSYLVVIQEGEVAGGAFNQSYSMMIEKPVNTASSALWGHGMIHETFHLWNGRGLVPSEQMEWFKEGLTEYMSIRIQAATGSQPRKIIEKKIETAYRRYFLSTMMGPPISLQEAGNNKNQNRMKIYGLGTFIALVLDVEIRHATANKKGIEEVLRLMYQEMALQGKGYNLNDVISYTNRVAGTDLTHLFNSYVTGTNVLKPNKYLAKGGLVLNTFYDDAYLSLLEGADELALNIGRHILGE